MLDSGSVPAFFFNVFNFADTSWSLSALVSEIVRLSTQCFLIDTEFLLERVDLLEAVDLYNKNKVNVL